MSDFDELIINYNELLLAHSRLQDENKQLAEYGEVADLKIEQLESYVDQLELQVSMQQSSQCEE